MFYLNFHCEIQHLNYRSFCFFSDHKVTYLKHITLNVAKFIFNAQEL